MSEKKNEREKGRLILSTTSSGHHQTTLTAGQVTKLQREIDSWRNFRQALRSEDRDTLTQMIEDVSAKYADAIENCGRGYITEAFLISLILSQNRAISFVSRQIEAIKEKMTDSEGK